jgi:hypothetical protein
MDAAAANSHSPNKSSRSPLDWFLVVLATAIFCVLAVFARAPNIAVNWLAFAALAIAMLVFLAACGLALWRVTRFN